MQKDAKKQIEYPPTRLWLAIKKGFVDSYYYLGLVVAASLIWVIAVSVPASVGGFLASITKSMWPVAVGFVVSSLIALPMTAGTLKLAYGVVYNEGPSLSDILDGFREYLGASLFWGSLNAAVIIVLVTDALFFLGIIGPFRPNALRMTLGVFAIYALLVWLMMTMYQLSAVITARNAGRRGGVLAAIRNSFIMVVHNPGFTFGLFIVILGFIFLSAVSVIGILLLFAGVVSIIQMHALRELYVRYGVVKEPPAPEDQTGCDSGKRIVESDK